jgi:transposase InsO family protein
MCDATGLSQRRACMLTGLSLSTCRYEAQRPAADAHLSGRITELALERRRFGYRRIWQLLRREGLHVNHKRVYRLCAESPVQLCHHRAGGAVRQTAHHGCHHLLNAPSIAGGHRTDRMMRFKHRHNRSLLRFKISLLVC